MSQLAHRYAKAAWDVATSQKATQALVDDFTGFAQALASSPTLLQALTNPAFKDERTAVLDKLLQAHEVKPVARRVLALLLEHERMALVDEVSAALLQLADAAAGKMRAQVKLAVVPTDAQVKRIEEVLSQRMGKPVVVQVEIDADMVAGMVCRVGKLTFDSSLKKQLSQFAERAGAGGAEL